MSGTVVSINVSPDGGVPKRPVDRVMVEGVGIEGDYNWFRSNKKDGDPDRAVSIYAIERILMLQKEGHPIEVGSTGENLTVKGIPWSTLKIGMRLRAGDALLELSEPCAPCSKIGNSFVGKKFSRIDHEVEEGWSRWVARVVEPGLVETGDWIRIVDSSPS